LRAQGKLPGVIYGQGESVPVYVESRDVLKILSTKGGANNIITTKLEGDKKDRVVMIKDIDSHPLTDQLIHIDFLEIDIDKPVRAAVELDYDGTPVGVKEKGGKLIILRNKAHVECMPKDIPSGISVPLAGLDAGQEIKLKDVQIPAGVTLLDDLEITVVAVQAPKVEKAAAGEGEGEGEEEAAG